MFHIYCPWCEEHREEEEFHAKGPAHLVRPKEPEACTDEEWGDYLFFRDNPRGVHHELWVHAAGCRKFFNITRHTVTYEILGTYKVGQLPAKVSEAEVVALPVRHEPTEKAQDDVRVKVGGLS